MPNTARRGDVLERSMLESRIAAIGGMRDARSAGQSAATTVTIMPVANDQITALAGITIELAGMSSPSAASSALSPHGEEDARDEPDGRRGQADQHRFEQHGAEHLSLRRRRWPAAARARGRAGRR